VPLQIKPQQYQYISREDDEQALPPILAKYPKDGNLKAI
jgi:hypothetical protein